MFLLFYDCFCPLFMLRLRSQGVMKVLTEERKTYLLQQIEKEGFIKNTEMAEQLKTSISTVRRDLQELENDGLIRRIHGGAQRITPLMREDSILEKATQHPVEKQKIAQYAARYIEQGDVIFLDAGSTTFEMIPFLHDLSITVVTNSVIHAAALAEQQITTIVLGGLIKPDTKAIINTTAFEQLQSLRFDKCFIGTNSITAQFGYATPDIEEAHIKQLAIQNSQQSFVLADHSKFKKSSFVHFAQLSAARIITDYCPIADASLQNQTTIEEI